MEEVVAYGEDILSLLKPARLGIIMVLLQTILLYSWLDTHFLNRGP